MNRLPRQIKEPLLSARFELRKVSGALRAFPDFIIVGAQKAGTTSLHAYLVQHPEITGPYVKEVHYFDGGLNPQFDSFAEGENWYRAHFPFKRDVRGLAFEASPLYLFNPLCAERIYNRAPTAKIIIMLRDPIERALSQYFHNARYGLDDVDLETALATEEERLAPALRAQDYKSKAFINYSYKARGCYAEQIARYFEFFPKEQILILESERFFADPSTTLRRTCEFVGVNPDADIGDLTPVNVGANRRKADEAVYDSLQAYFANKNEALGDLLGERFEWT